MRRTILLSVFGAFLYIMMGSNKQGAANLNGIDGTGASGGNTGCSGRGCHGTATVSTLGVTVELDSQGVAVTSYHPGRTYNVKITSTNNSGVSLPQFGFQLATVLSAGAATSSCTQAGIWGSSLPSGVQNTSASISGLTIPMIEQSQGGLTPTSGTGSNGTVYSESISWTAPAAGTGSIKIYGVINAVNGNGNNDNTDRSQMATPITITEARPSGINDISTMLTGLNVYPTLINDNMTVAFDLVEANKVSVSIISIQGQTIKTLIAAESINSGTFNRSFSISELPAGIYLVRVQVGNAYTVSKVVKG